jgi:peroxiredoxin
MKLPDFGGVDGLKLARICLFVSVCANVALTLQLVRARSLAHSKTLGIGSRAHAVALTSTTGSRLALEFPPDSLPTLFYWFSPTCGWCELNLPNLEALAAQAHGKYRLFAVSTASPADLADYAARHDLSFPLYTISAHAASQYHFFGTPTSLLVFSDGRIGRGWSGAYTPSTLVDIEKSLAVSLPGTAKPPGHGGN